ncbi:MAG: ACT domain-containing protein [Candidatus Altiarchaeota archaeon]
MKQISEVVGEVLKSDLRIMNALQMGIVNHHSLARRIQPEVVRRLGHQAGTSTIAVSIQRIAARIMSNEVDESLRDLFSKSRLQLRDDIALLYLKGDSEFKEPKYTSVIDANRGFYVKIQGIGTTTILVADEDLGDMGIRGDDIYSKIKDLSAIIITSPKEIVHTPGVIAQLMTALGGSRINLVEVTSSYDNTFLIVDKKDSLKAIEVIRQLIERTKRV